ncbi:type VII secretion-associated protein [Gordonia sp. SL306]|uniref:type VII secretion-associated protein n=1 Tax=Gordonia sp. SL306 TaxID=2995145 RepID=UPI00226DDCF9|nr:type VII secretion-associated protein [Gordonia sp. SL306]WAC54712.1 type VII secretion-associated protein [Gordonia sp. SL306]
MPTALRPTVVDLAFGQVSVSGGRSADVTDLLEGADAPTVMVAGTRRYGHQAWQAVLRDLHLPDAGPDGPLPMVIGYPSTWGRVRSSVLDRATAEFGAAVTLVPRAVLIARSHSDGTMQRCAVVETTHFPGVAVDPARPRQAWWDVTRLRRTSGGWEIEAVDVLEPESDGVAGRTEAIVDDSVEAVFVDGSEPAEVTRAIDVVATHALAGRVVAVDRELIRRYGWRSGRPEGADPPIGAIERPAQDSAGPTRGRTGRWIVAAGVAAVGVALVAGVVGFLQRGGEGPPVEQTVTLGRTDIDIPADWRRSELGRPDAGGTDEPLRSVFADPADGRRILVVQSEVRTDSTLASVATSLGNRIRQRGDDVVTEFSAVTRFMGREVISYREAPASGSAIRWYVLVEHGLQVSVGCQAGTAGESVDAECAHAVSSVRIAPR